MKEEKEINYNFIASSKVIRYKLGHKAADILAVLMYKHKYWKDKERLISFKGRKGFYISNIDLQEETCFKKDVICKNVNVLKKAGLIEVYRQGLGKSNVYFVNEAIIQKYINDHKLSFKNWRESLRDSDTAVIPKPVQIAEKPISESGFFSPPNVEESDTTNNRNTKNKTTKTFTNLMNEDQLEEMINDLKYAGESLNKSLRVAALYNFLRSAVPGFEKYSMSWEDYELIKELGDSQIYAYIVADKIISNAKSISEQKKKSRFGSLFVGLKEMNDGYNYKYNK